MIITSVTVVNGDAYESKWHYCDCGQKLFKVLPTTRLKDHVCYCKKCRKEVIVNTEEDC